VALLAGGVLAGLWFCLISYQQAGWRWRPGRSRHAEGNFKTSSVVRSATQIEGELKETGQKLAAIELDMPPATSILVISRFKQFNVPAITWTSALSQPVGRGDAVPLSVQQATVSWPQRVFLGLEISGGV